MRNGWRRRGTGPDRHTVEAGAWLHRAIVWLIGVGILLGAGLIAWSLLGPEGGGTR